MTSSTKDYENDNLAGVTQSGTKPAEVIPQAAAEEEIIETKKSRFMNTPHASLLNDLWGVSTIDVFADEAIRDATASKHGIIFDLINGHKIQWLNTANGEFIGALKKNAPFDADDAAAVISLCKTRGWTSVDVHGPVEHRELMWLEAQRQGLAVSNFEPKQDSAILQKWKAEQDLIAKQKEEQEPDTDPADLTGVSQTSEAPAVTAEAKKGPAEAAEQQPAAKQPAAHKKVPRFVVNAHRAANNGPAFPKQEAPQKAEIKAAEVNPAEVKAAEAPKATESKFSGKKPKTDIKALRKARNQQRKAGKGPSH